MSPRFLSRAELARLLSPYKCRKRADIMPGIEMWETGWGEPFTLSFEANGFDYWQCRRAITEVISPSMPPDWLDKNGNGGSK